MDLSRLKLAAGSDLSLAGQLSSQLALLIADGELRPGDPLPAVRTLARSLEISVNTVRAAYSRLEADGLVTTRHGAGTMVAASAVQAPRKGTAPLGSNAVGVLIAGLDPFYLPLLRGIEDVAEREGLLVLVADTRDSPELAAAMIRRLVARGIDGLIAVSVGSLDDGQRADRRRRGAPPIVYVDQPDRKGHVFDFDAERGGYLATAHLLDHGHRRLALVTAPLAWPNVAPLHRGFARALAERGIDSGTARIVEVPGYALDHGRQALASLMEPREAPTAAFTAGADLALGVVDAARSRGLKVPDDLAVVGYTDIEAARIVQPPLTTVAVPAREAGLRAMETLRRLMAGKAVSPKRVVFDVELVVRSSCGRH